MKPNNFWDAKNSFDTVDDGEKVSYKNFGLGRLCFHATVTKKLIV